MSSQEAAIAATRFGMGAQAGEISSITGDARGWLEQQLLNPDAALVSGAALKSSEQIGEMIAQSVGAQRMMRRSGADSQEKQKKRKATRQQMRGILGAEIFARNTHAVETQAGFLERWVRFWGNHFTVGARKLETIGLVGAFEREAIRENAFGSFARLLEASTFHGAMLIYLDNHRSIGPSTRIAERRGVGLNENLAREVLELHTLGVGGGYTQEDVEAFSKALTGWTIAMPPLTKQGIGKVTFAPRLHEPGRKKILGVSYASSGADEAKNILRDLAAHPSTAKHVAVKLVRHFVSDEPPASAVSRLENVFLETSGDLTELARAVIHIDAAWEPEPKKFKTPEELLISSARGLGGYAVFGGARDLRKIYESLGQQPFGAPSPDGWPDVAADWAGPDAIKKRLEWANRAGQRGQSRMNASAFLSNALGDLVGDETRLSVSRAESNAQGLTLALMSPEFQRR